MALRCGYKQINVEHAYSVYMLLASLSPGPPESWLSFSAASFGVVVGVLVEPPMWKFTMQCKNVAEGRLRPCNSWLLRADWTSGMCC